MENKIPDGLLTLYESMLSAQLRVVRQLKTPKPGKPKPQTKADMSKIYMALDLLHQAYKPLHVSEILALDRESLVSALVKKLHRDPGLTRTGPNTFEATHR